GPMIFTKGTKVTNEERKFCAFCAFSWLINQILYTELYRIIMRVLALMPALYDTSPGQRYRLEQWEPLLRERGVDITFASFEDEELHALLYKRGMMPKKLQLVTR